MRLDSLAARTLILSSLWAVIAVLLIAYVIIALYRSEAEKSFDNLLSAHLFNLISAVGVSDSGDLTGAPDLGDLSYTRPLSGWYWAVEPVTPNLKGAVRSPSMNGRSVPSVSTQAVSFDSNFRRAYMTEGLDGEILKAVEAEYVMDSQGNIARFRVMGNASEFEAGINAFARQLAVYLALFGLGSVAVNALAILFGLRPLDHVRQALSAIRAGNRAALEGRFPREIEPLVKEMNALIDNNRRIVERSRTQVGNLAHSLKTPLAVIVNEGAAVGGATGERIGAQARAMEYQIQHYLQKARIAAQRDSVVFRTPVAPQIETLVRVMKRINPGKEIVAPTPAGGIVFAGEKEDLDEIAGNLLENAAKWSRSRIEVAAAALAPEADGRRFFTLIVDDDGPGIAEADRQKALKRGQRLDEKTPGTGLGLSIVVDTAREYGGDVALSRSPQGGLRVVVTLPMAPE